MMQKEAAVAGGLLAYAIVLTRCVRHNTRVGVLVVIAVVDVLGRTILLACQGVPILRRQVATICRTHVAILSGDMALPAFRGSRTFRGDLAILHAVSNATLLVILARLNGVALGVGCLLRKCGGYGEDNE